MKPRDLLILGARLIGIWYICTALHDLRTLIDIALNLYTPVRTPTTTYIEIFALNAGIGIFLFLFSHRLVDLVDASPKSETTSTDSPK